jgi:ubiquinone/menaquinone biosynthesis C-methylase UbiE
MIETDWDRLFDELYLRTYGGRQAPAEAEELALGAVAVAEVEPGAEVLDAACGCGRHSLVLARSGYRVTGADRSPVLLAEARRLAGDAEWPSWVQADYRELPFADESFDAVLCLFSSIGFYGEDGDGQALAEFRRVLRPGGGFVLETMHRDRLAAIFQPRGWEDLPAGLLVEERRFDLAAGVIETDHVLVNPDGKREGLTYRLRIYTATEVVRMLREAGFAQVELYGDFERSALTPQTRLIAVAH